MRTAATGEPLSAFAGELLLRTQKYLIGEMRIPGRGAFGRVVQEALELALGVLDPSLKRNPGAGIPDCWCSLSSQRCACEIKYTDNGEVALGERDIEGMRLGGEGVGARLIVLDIGYPARLWVLNSADIELGEFRPASHSHLQIVEEAGRVAVQLELLLREADIDLIAPEADGKSVLGRAAEQLNNRRSSPAGTPIT